MENPIIQETQPQNSEPALNNGEKKERDERGRFLPGWPGGGKTLGSTHYRTDFRRAIQKIAKANKITPEETMDILHRAGYNQAKDGNFQYYKEIVDRIYGRPKGEGEGMQITVQIINWNGDNNSVPIHSEAVPVGLSQVRKEVQDSGISSESGEVKDGAERAGQEEPVT